MTTYAVSRSSSRKERERFESLIRNVPTGIYRTTPDGRILFANPALIQMLGYDSFQELSVLNLEVNGFQVDYDRALFRQCIEADGEIRGWESTWQRRDGSLIHIRESARAIRPGDRNSRVLYYEGTVEDVSAQKRGEEQYRLLFATNPNPMWVYDREMLCFLAVNDAAVRHYGYTREEFLAMTIAEIRPDEDRERVFNSAYAVGDTVYRSSGWQHRRKDGSLIAVEIHSSPLVFEGRAARMVMVNDITERLQAEDAVRASEARMQALVKNMPVVVFGLDPDGVFTFTGGKGLDSIHLQAGDYVGRSAFDVHHDHPEMQEFIRQSLRGRETACEIQYQGIWYEIQCTLLPEENGENPGIVGVAMDVTERKKLRAHVLQQEKMATVGELAAGIAHEVNNPLAAISGYAQLLAQHPDHLVREDAEGIRSMADRAGRVVRSLLTFARSGSHVTLEERTENALYALVEEALALCLPTLRQAGIDVTTCYAETNPPIVRVNGTQIVQVILNLLSNAEHALRCCPPTQRHIQIETALEGSVALLRVRDNGTGMPEEIRRRIFEPFFTTKDVGTGTGLGLAISHGIVTSHRGEIAVDSEVGVGTAFTLRLPATNVNQSLPETAVRSR